MNLNYLAFFLISFVPLIIAYVWFHPRLAISKWASSNIQSNPIRLTPFKILLALIMSITIVYGYINLVIHQMGFYELFFTDIMQGKESSKLIVEDFLGKYGDKHRHFGHGVFHGAINGLVFALPFISYFTFVEKRNARFVWFHLGYWMVTSIIIGGLISEFV